MSPGKRTWAFKESSVGQSFLWSLVLTVLPVLSSFFVSWAVARFGGADIWGTVTWAMALATALLIVGKLGLGLGSSRLASEYGVDHPGQLRKLFRVAFTMRATATLAVSSVAFMLAPQISAWFGNDDLTGPTRAACLIVVCASFFEFQEHFLVGLNRHAIVSRVRALMLSSRIVITFALISTGVSAVALLGGYIVAWGLGMIVFAILLHRYLPRTQTESVAIPLRQRLLALSIPLAISGASVTIYSQMDKLMLGYFYDVNEVGQYAIARAVTDVSLFPAFALVMMLRPALASRYAAGAIDACSQLIRRSLRLSFVSGVMFASVLSVLAVPLLTFVYSDEFSYAGELMSIFVWVIVLRSVGALVLPALLAAERTRTYALLTAGSALINFFLNLVFIPHMQARGAILATIISYALLLLFGLGKVMRIFRVKIGSRALSLVLRTVIAGALAALPVWLGISQIDGDWSRSGWMMIVWAALQAALYLGLVALFRVIQPADIRSLVQLRR